jgi:hypothetical protein
MMPASMNREALQRALLVHPVGGVGDPAPLAPFPPRGEDRGSVSSVDGGTRMTEQQKKSDDRAYRMRTRGIALVILGAIPAFIGFAMLGEPDAASYMPVLIVGLILIGAGVMVWGRSRVI